MAQTNLMGLRNAAAQNKGVVAAYVHKKDSYRVKLSDASLADLIIKVEKFTPKKDATGTPPDVTIEIYSKSIYEASGSKATKDYFKYYIPESVLRWSNVHTIGETHPKAPTGDIAKRKCTITVQTYFPEDIDGMLNQNMNAIAKKGIAPPYRDINVEHEWHAQQLGKLNDMILRAIFACPDADKTARIAAFESAQELVAASRGVEPHLVPFTDPDVIEKAYLKWRKDEKIHRPVSLDPRNCEPDICSLAELCPGPACKHESHVHGKKHYVIKMQDRVFKQRNKDANLPTFPADATEAAWVHANPLLLNLIDADEKKKRMEAHILKELTEAGYDFKPVYYKTRRTVNQSWKIAAVKGIEAGYFDAPHSKQLDYGNVVRLCVHPSAQCFTVQAGIGMRLTFDSNDILIVRGKRVECTIEEADEIMTFDDDDIDFTKPIEERPMYGSDLPASGSKRTRDEETDVGDKHTPMKPRLESPVSPTVPTPMDTTGPANVANPQHPESDDESDDSGTEVEKVDAV